MYRALYTYIRSGNDSCPSRIVKSFFDLPAQLSFSHASTNNRRLRIKKSEVTKKQTKSEPRSSSAHSPVLFPHCNTRDSLCLCHQTRKEREARHKLRWSSILHSCREPLDLASWSRQNDRRANKKVRRQMKDKPKRPPDGASNQQYGNGAMLAHSSTEVVHKHVCPNVAICIASNRETRIGVAVSPSLVCLPSSLREDRTLLPCWHSSVCFVSCTVVRRRCAVTMQPTFSPLRCP